MTPLRHAIILHTGLLLSAALLAGCASTNRPPSEASSAPLVDPPTAPSDPVDEPHPEGKSQTNEQGQPSPDRNEPLELTIEEALLLALENNRTLRVQRIAPSIRRAVEQSALGAFDPVFSAQAVQRRSEIDRPPGDGREVEDQTRLEAGVSLTRPEGTRLALELDADLRDRSSRDDEASARVGVALTQPLLRGAGRAANLAELRQARLDTERSEYEVQGIAEEMIARVENTYRDYLLAKQQQTLVTASLKLAERQMEETRQRIRVGGLPGTEMAAAEAEVAIRREALINAQSRVDILRVRLLRHIQPQRLAHATHVVHAAAEPDPPADAIDALPSHLNAALALRADLNQARLLLQRGELELVRTANGLLPRLDLFARLGKSGYADALRNAFEDLDGRSFDASIGVGVELSAGNRAARGRHQAAFWTREQSMESLRNVEDMIREEVQIAYLEVLRSRRQIDATAATRRLQEETLRAEMAKYAAGQSTALFVAQAQRDLLAAQFAEVESITAYRKSLTNLYLLDGTLLQRRGIAIR